MCLINSYGETPHAASYSESRMRLPTVRRRMRQKILRTPS